MRPRSPLPKLARALAASLLALLAFAPPALAGFAPPEAHSPGAEEIRTSYWIMLVVATVLGVAILAGLGAAYLRFRVRSHRDLRQPARRSAGRGAVTRVVVALGALATAIFVFGVIMNRQVEDAVAERSSGEPLSINAVGQQWLWRFEYPSEREDIATLFSYNELVVPVETTVNLSIGSTDVLHRWFIPELGGQVQAVPGEIARTSFRADREGVYGGQSTQFSGTGYPAMRAWVRVVSQAEYDRYIAQLDEDLAAAQSSVQDEFEAGEGS